MVRARLLSEKDLSTPKSFSCTFAEYNGALTRRVNNIILSNFLFHQELIQLSVAKIIFAILKYIFKYFIYSIPKMLYERLENVTLWRCMIQKHGKGQKFQFMMVKSKFIWYWDMLLVTDFSSCNFLGAIIVC